MDAYEQTKHNPSVVWKISWEKNRWRPKTKNNADLWNPISEAKLSMLCPAYGNAKTNELFWVDQLVSPPIQILQLESVLSPDLYDEISALCLIRDILPDKEFRQKFGALRDPPLKVLVVVKETPLVAQL